MLPGKTREELESNLIAPILAVKRRRYFASIIKKRLMKTNKIMEGNIQTVINNPKAELSKLDWRVLFLFAEQVHNAVYEDFLESHKFNPHNFFTEVEIRRARQYTGRMFIEGDLTLPLTLENVLMIDQDKYVTTISASLLAELSSLLLNYNFDIQREAKTYVVDGETIKEATLIMDNVLEMKEHLKNDTLETTSIVINASVGTAYSGEEIYYNPETLELVINEGTVLDIVDGFHRSKASELAINEKPNIEFRFILQLLNYTDDRAAKYQGQLAKATPLAKSRQQQLAQSRYVDRVMKSLEKHSELKGKITNNKVPSLKRKELIAYSRLADAVDEEFVLERMVDVHLVSDYLKKYFDMLLGYFEEDFLINPLKSRKKSLLVDSNMFVGYVVLARRLYENKMDAQKVLQIISSIDFSIDNKMWWEIGVLNEKGNLNRTNQVYEAIKKLFNNIELKNEGSVLM